MGTVFGFVSSDVRSKIEILEAHRQKDNAEQFESFAKMMEYEKSSSLLDKKDYVSGSRTLLRLHRGLGNVNNVNQIFSIQLKRFCTCPILHTHKERQILTLEKDNSNR